MAVIQLTDEPELDDAAFIANAHRIFFWLPALDPTKTTVRRAKQKPGERMKRCNGCSRDARELCWLQQTATKLPLTMPLCADCLHSAANAIPAVQ